MNDNFINTWVPNCELGRIHSLREPIAKRREREGKSFDTSHALAQTIIKGWKTGSKKGSPVDCLVISPAFELMGRVLVNDLDEDRERSGWRYDYEYYLAFLKEALAGKQPGLGNVVLTAEDPSQEVLDIFRTPTVGYQDYTVAVIDATAFENGGTLTIDIKIGREEGEAAFYLFDGDTELSTEEEKPKDMLTWEWGEPGDTRQITHAFDRGQFFKLGVTGHWARDEPCINAFRATVSIQENSNEDTSGRLSTGLHVVLDSTQSSLEILDIFRAPGNGYQDYTVVNIDTTTFKDGGTLTTHIRVGSADAPGSFDLFDSDTELPTEGIPEALVSAWGIKPKTTTTISHRFERGEVFKLGATGDWFSKKGDMNAFYLNISVEEN
ncbi:hypothetical protein F4009_14290 [Candidatus Poribacteria bacterium]|nr:hypothetical protein [Candidatus Poribacteria bacterium]MYK95143.1 hypothetical protein [Candidatus Poribacteria bacterium]